MRTALDEGRPVVALETTLIAHGFPPGEGVAVGLESERRVREAGAVPATIGVLDGEVRVGLDEDELEQFGADRAQARAARRRRRGRAARGRRDDRRRDARGRAHGRPSLHGHRGDRRSPPRLDAAAGRLLRPRRARANASRRRRLGREVDPRRACDRGGARDARHPDARLPHRHAAALLRGGGRAAGLRARRVAERGRPRSRAATGSSAARACSSATRRRRASTTSRG